MSEVSNYVVIPMIAGRYSSGSFCHFISHHCISEVSKYGVVSTIAVLFSMMAIGILQFIIVY